MAARRFNYVRKLIPLIVIVGLAHLLSVHTLARAAASYKVIVGQEAMSGIGVHAFGPQLVKVHRGDTVTWQFEGFHDMRFDQTPVDLLVNSQIDGKSVVEMNPIVVFPTVKSGDSYQAGAASRFMTPHGSPMGGPNTLTLIMDAAPGTYTVICDFHPGMIGMIMVVDDNTEIPAPAEVEEQGRAELDAALDAAQKAYLNLLNQTSWFPTSGDTLSALAGGAEGPAIMYHFFPEAAQITAGESVTWTVPRGLEGHTINFSAHLVTECRVTSAAMKATAIRFRLTPKSSMAT